MASPRPSPPPPAAVDLHHPLPDLQSLQGAYVGNINRLEEHAERMSEHGSDLGDEIRKLHTELKLSDSRRSSLHSLRSLPPAIDDHQRQRGLSTSSHTTSIVDTNNAARWGGYSPAGYVTSPAGSLQSGSWSNAPSNLGRHRSGSRASRLGHVVTTNPDLYSLHDAPKSAPPPRTSNSFTRKYEEIAGELRDELHHSHPNHHDFPDRPATAASTDTTHQARTLWHDFDGAHCPDTVPEEPEPRSRPSSMTYDRPSSMARDQPPHDNGMVYYPAPVPRMLNLPKRLSQLPAGDVAARRRTQVLESMQAENRKSAAWHTEPEPVKPTRKNRQSTANLPPALRASAYFDQSPQASQEFVVKGESAQDTLDNILEASARAPVSAFTDHPFSGHVGNEVYGAQHNRKSSKFSDQSPKPEETKRRSSFHMLDTKRNSNGDMLKKLKKRNSSADMNLLITKASESRMSLGAELDERDEDARGPHESGHHDDGDTTPRRASFVDERHSGDEFETELGGEEDEEPEEEQYFGAPTTLLAELQLRKAKQKDRNMNYATLIEQGRMTSHRTLLEINDEAEKEKQKRLRKKVQLAWEADQDDSSDDDVPLGVLYKQNQQNNDWDRPVGLIAQRELEDSEPLSRRRNRLLGANPDRLRDPSPNRRTTQFLQFGASQQHLEIPTSTTPLQESEGEENETLGERMRRLKDKQMLEAALGDDVRKSTVSGDFAAEMLSKLGMPEDEEEEKAPVPAATPSGAANEEEEEEETLGQRRARLQAEAEARGEDLAPGSRPALRSSMSLADVLAANPYDQHHQARKVSNEQLISQLPPGSLLHQSAVAEDRRKTQRLTQNMRASSYGAGGGVGLDPLVRGAEKHDEDQPLAAKIQAYKNKMAGLTPQDTGAGAGAGRAPSMLFNGSQMGNMGMQMPMTPMNMPMGMNPMAMQSQLSLQPQQRMSMAMPMGMHGINGMNMGINGMPMQMGMPMGMGMPGAMGRPMSSINMGGGMPMGGMPGLQDPMMMGPPMNPQQRNNIEGWMRGIR